MSGQSSGPAGSRRSRKLLVGLAVVAALLIAGALAGPAVTRSSPTASSSGLATATVTTTSRAAQPVVDETAIAAAESSLASAEADATGGATNVPSSGQLGALAAGSAVSGAAPASALAALAAVPVKGRAPMTGYSRSQFGSGWVDTDHNGCDTRNDVLARDLTGETFKPGTRDCVVLTGRLADPYSGRSIAFQRGQTTSTAVQIDHVVALGDAWQTGAQGWSAATRVQFANDPRNLLAVDGPLNEQKGDGDAATWLPPNTSFRCDYVARQVAVKVVYGLWMTQAEWNASATVLQRCPTLPLPNGVVAHLPQPAPAPAPAPAPRTTYAPKPAPVPAPAPAPMPAPAPAPAHVVHPGAFCSPAGATGVTSTGKPMVCRTSATDTRLRWRSP